MKCREKELPHYFGRLIHALDLIKFSQNEGTLKNLQQQQSPFKILLLGADLKHVLRSVAETVDFKGQFQFVLTDSNPHVQARNLILLGILLGEEYHGGDEENSALAFTRASYSLHLDGKTFHKMKKVISDILQGLQPAGKNVTFDDPDGKILQIIKIWNNNLASIDRRIRLLEKMKRVRNAKTSMEFFAKFHNDFMGQLLMSDSLGVAQARASDHWIVTGDFALHSQALCNTEDTTTYPNILLTCVNPLHPKASEFYDQRHIDSELLKYKIWLQDAEVDDEDELIFASHAIDSPFQDWDPLEVLASFDRTIDEDMASDDNLVLLAFEEFIQDISQIFRDVCKANFVQLQVNHQDVFQFNGKHAYSKSFDRIFTGIMCDVFGTQKVLQTMEPLVSCSNPFATILSFHRVWRLGLKAVGRPLNFQSYIIDELKADKNEVNLIQRPTNQITKKIVKSQNREISLPDPWLRILEWQFPVKTKIPNCELNIETNEETVAAPKLLEEKYNPNYAFDYSSSSSSEDDITLTVEMDDTVKINEIKIDDAVYSPLGKDTKEISTNHPASVRPKRKSKMSSSNLMNCFVCKKNFKSIKELQTHQRANHRKFSETSKGFFICQRCGEHYFTQKNLEIHLFELHKIKKESMFANTSSSSSSVSSADEKEFPKDHSNNNNNKNENIENILTQIAIYETKYSSSSSSSSTTSESENEDENNPKLKISKPPFHQRLSIQSFISSASDASYNVNEVNAELNFDMEDFDHLDDKEDPFDEIESIQTFKILKASTSTCSGSTSDHDQDEEMILKISETEKIDNNNLTEKSQLKIHHQLSASSFETLYEPEMKQLELVKTSGSSSSSSSTSTDEHDDFEDHSSDSGKENVLEEKTDPNHIFDYSSSSSSNTSEKEIENKQLKKLKKKSNKIHLNASSSSLSDSEEERIANKQLNDLNKTIPKEKLSKSMEDILVEKYDPNHNFDFSSSSSSYSEEEKIVNKQLNISKEIITTKIQRNSSSSSLSDSENENIDEEIPKEAIIKKAIKDGLSSTSSSSDEDQIVNKEQNNFKKKNATIEIEAKDNSQLDKDTWKEKLDPILIFDFSSSSTSSSDEATSSSSSTSSQDDDLNEAIEVIEENFQINLESSTSSSDEENIKMEVEKNTFIIGTTEPDADPIPADTLEDILEAKFEAVLSKKGRIKKAQSSLKDQFKKIFSKSTDDPDQEQSHHQEEKKHQWHFIGTSQSFDLDSIEPNVKSSRSSSSNTSSDSEKDIEKTDVIVEPIKDTHLDKLKPGKSSGSSSSNSSSDSEKEVIEKINEIVKPIKDTHDSNLEKSKSGETSGSNSSSDYEKEVIENTNVIVEPIKDTHDSNLDKSKPGKKSGSSSSNSSSESEKDVNENIKTDEIQENTHKPKLDSLNPGNISSHSESSSSSSDDNSDSERNSLKLELDKPEFKKFKPLNPQCKIRLHENLASQILPIETSHDNNDTSEAIKDSNSSENDIENIDSDDIQTAEAKFENLYRSLKKTSSSSSSSDSEDEDNVEVLDQTQKINQDLKFDLEIKSQDDIEKAYDALIKENFGDDDRQAKIDDSSSSSSSSDSDSDHEEEAVVENILKSFVSKDGKFQPSWSSSTEVIDSGVLDTISNEDKKLYESLYEVVTSETSYNKSLNVLMKYFAQSPKLSGIGSNSLITKWEHKILFGNVMKIQKCSDRFLEDLKSEWKNSIFLDGLCEVVREHAKNHFQVYIKYCSNMVDQGSTLKVLRKRGQFVDALDELESNPECRSLKFQSFLVLPMQRITRLPLLIGAILKRLEPNSPKYQVCEEALEIVKKIVLECNEAALIEARRKELLQLEKQLKFPKKVKLFPLYSASRWLVKRGDAKRIFWNDKNNPDGKSPTKLIKKFGWKDGTRKEKYHLLLFNDILVVTKRKNNETYLVVDYAQRNVVHMSSLTEKTFEKFPDILDHVKDFDLSKSILFTILNNHKNKTVDWLLKFSNETDRAYWLDVFSPHPSVISTNDNQEKEIEISPQKSLDDTAKKDFSLDTTAPFIPRAEIMKWYTDKKDSMDRISIISFESSSDSSAEEENILEDAENLASDHQTTYLDMRKNVAKSSSSESDTSSSSMDEKEDKKPDDEKTTRIKKASFFTPKPFTSVTSPIKSPMSNIPGHFFGGSSKSPNSTSSSSSDSEEEKIEKKILEEEKLEKEILDEIKEKTTDISILKEKIVEKFRSSTSPSSSDTEEEERIEKKIFDDKRGESTDNISNLKAKIADKFKKRSTTSGSSSENENDKKEPFEKVIMSKEIPKEHKISEKLDPKPNNLTSPYIKLSSTSSSSSNSSLDSNAHCVSLHVEIDLHDDKDQLKTLEEKFEALYEEEQQKDDDLTKKLPKSSFSISSSTSSSSDEETSPSVTKLIAKIESKSSPNQISQYKPKISSNDNNKENKNEDPEAIFEHLYESTVKDEIDIKPDMEIWKQIETFKAKTTDRSFSIVSNMAQKGSTDDEAANTKINELSFGKKMIKVQSRSDRPSQTFSKIERKLQSGGEESEDGGGSWYKYADKRNRGPKNNNNLSKSSVKMPKIDSSSSSDSESSHSESENKESSKLLKHKPPYKVQKIPKNQLESEDGGGSWHQHVSKRHGSSTNLSKSCILDEFQNESQSSSSTGSDDNESDLEETNNTSSIKLSKHGSPYKILQKIPQNKLESEDGGGNWHKHVSMRRRGNKTGAGNLSRSRNPSDQIQLNDPPGTSSSSSGGESDDSKSNHDLEISTKLLKHLPTFKVQKIPKNRLESEDGGGSWHQHVGPRLRNESGNLSKNRLEQEDLSEELSASSSESSSSSDEEDTKKYVKHHISMPNLGQKPKALSLRKGSVGSNSDDDENTNRFGQKTSLTSPNSVLHRASSMVEIPRFSFAEKKQRLNEVLFGDKELTNENVISPVKGRTPVREIKRQLELQAASPNNLNSPDSELPPLSPVSVRQMVHSYQHRLRKKSSSSPPPRHRSTLRSEAEIRLNSQSRARSLSTPKKLPIENLLKNFEEVDKEENKVVVEMEKPEIPIGRPLIVYDNSSDSEEEEAELPKNSPKKEISKETTKKPPRVIEVVENKHDAPRKSSMLTITNKPVRKRSVTILSPAGIKEEDTSSDGGGEEAPDSSGTKLSQPIDIRKLKIGMEHYKDSLDDEIPKPQPKLTRGFSEAARPPTPPNASHLVRESPPRTPKNTPSQF